LSLLRDLTRQNWDIITNEAKEQAPSFDGLLEASKRDLEEEMRQFLLYLADSPLPPMIMLKVGMAIGQLLRDNPQARPGDMFIAQWQAALRAIAEEDNDPTPSL
jgi:hypothetical protein